MRLARKLWRWLSRLWTARLAFECTSSEFEPGDVILTTDEGATLEGRIVDVLVTSGSWEAGDASGYLWVRATRHEAKY